MLHFEGSGSLGVVVLYPPILTVVAHDSQADILRAPPNSQQQYIQHATRTHLDTGHPRYVCRHIGHTIHPWYVVHIIGSSPIPYERLRRLQSLALGASSERQRARGLGHDPPEEGGQCCQWFGRGRHSIVFYIGEGAGHSARRRGKRSIRGKRDPAV